MERDSIFEPLHFRNLTVKNRVFRPNISGRFDNYDGSGTYARINPEEKFARGGVGAIISSFSPVHIRGRILPNYATIDKDETIPFWREVGQRVHQHDCKFIIQLSHSGRQQDVGGVENLRRKAWSSTSRSEPFMGFLCQAMTREQIKQTIQQFADAARRARLAGLDGVELHSANGYLFTQFLSSAINDRKDEYGGPLENRARFLLEVLRAIRKEVGDDFHLQFKISAEEYANAVFFWERRGNRIKDSVQVCKWAEEAGADAVHVSSGSSFPHPSNPPGGFPIPDAIRAYDTMLSSGTNTLFVYMSMRLRLLRPLFSWFWNHSKGDKIEGVNEDSAKAIKEVVKIPVICTGGFQTASYIRRIIDEGYCDAVSIARSLIANPDLVKIFASGRDLPERPCSYCNKCLVGVLENPLGCYDLDRFDGDYDRMINEVMSVFRPSPFVHTAQKSAGG